MVDLGERYFSSLLSLDHNYFVVMCPLTLLGIAFYPFLFTDRQIFHIFFPTVSCPSAGAPRLE